MAKKWRYVELIKKKAVNDLKYFERHGIKTDKADDLKYIPDDEIVSVWKDPDFKNLGYNDRIRKIASILVFPTELSRDRAEKLRMASGALGKPMDFADVLKGKFDWESLSKIREEKTIEFVKLYGPAGRKMASQYISQTYFGSR